MLARILFGAIAIFWATMNVLLWRSEVGARNPEGDEVPVRLVWRRILTSPDSSSLTIWRNKERLGFAHWISSVGEEFSTLEDAPPEGMAEQLKNYQIKLDGNVALREKELRLRFEFNLKLNTNQTWQEFGLQLSSRPVVAELRGVAAEKTLYFHLDDGERQTDRTFKLSDLQNPQALAGDLSGPAMLGLAGTLGLPADKGAVTSMPLGLKWDARSQLLAIGREPVRVYRLHTRLLDKYDVTIFVSRAGEILRVELPNDILLVQEQLTTR